MSLENGIPWWLGGILIGLMVPAFYLLMNKSLGVSTGYGNFLRILLPKSKLRWLNSGDFSIIFNWRMLFLLGIILGGFIGARLQLQPLVVERMGRLSESSDLPWLLQGVLLFIGGMLLALGARIAGGCTSGNSIHGISTLQPSGFVATFFFVLSGVIATWLVKMILFGGQ